MNAARPSLNHSLLAGQVALITGASRGIGAAVARLLTRQGAHVVLVARNEAGLTEIDDAIQSEGGSATLVPLDLRDFSALDRLGATLFERYGRLDILIGNAGLLGTLCPLTHISPKEWEDILAVNLTANWRLLRSLDPLLRVAPAARALFVTSAAAAKARPFWGTYAISKSALEMTVLTYAAEVAHGPVRVNLIDPGRVRTDMRKKAYPGEDPLTLPTPEDIAPAFLELVHPDCPHHGQRFIASELLSAMVG